MEVLRGDVARVIALPIFRMTLLHRIILQMSQWRGVIRLIMRR
jgi:hypothetical protein